MSFSEWIISHTGRQTMVKLFYTTFISVDLAQYEIYVFKFAISCKDGITLAPRLYFFFMLNSTQHEIFLLINVKMPTIVGILTFMSGKNNILGLSEPKEAKFLDIYILMSI